MRFIEASFNKLLKSKDKKKIPDPQLHTMFQDIYCFIQAKNSNNKNDKNHMDQQL